MFQKHTTTAATGGMYEKKSGSIWYRIYDVGTSRHIDEDKYVPYLEWTGTMEVIDVTPQEPEPVIPTPSLEERTAALEDAVAALLEG